MSIGNLKNDGNKGNNFPWQLKMLLGQQCACDALQELVDNTDTVEPLLAQILAAVQQGTDYEAALVVDANDDTWLEIRVWNGLTFNPPIYFLAGSNTAGTPVAPITYINPNTFLAQIVSNTTGLATQTTLAAVDTKLTSVVRTAGIIRSTAVGNVNTVAAQFYSVSVANTGLADGEVLGEVIRPGEILNFAADSLNNYFTSFAYDATGTDFLITFVY